MSDGPGNRKSGTSYEETAAFSTMREERGFNPRVIDQRFTDSQTRPGPRGVRYEDNKWVGFVTRLTIISSLRDHIVQNMEWLYRI